LHLTSEPLREPHTNGRLAQLVERFVYTEDVGSSSLSSPTIRLQNVLLQKFPVVRQLRHLSIARPPEFGCSALRMLVG
jgi:hypothetical protein